MLPINPIGITYWVGNFSRDQRSIWRSFTSISSSYHVFLYCGGSEFSMKYHFSLNKIVTIEIYVLELVHVFIFMSIKNALFDLG